MDYFSLEDDRLVLKRAQDGDARVMVVYDAAPDLAAAIPAHYAGMASVKKAGVTGVWYTVIAYDGFWPDVECDAVAQHVRALHEVYGGAAERLGLTCRVDCGVWAIVVSVRRDIDTTCGDSSDSLSLAELDTCDRALAHMADVLHVGGFSRAQLAYCAARADVYIARGAPFIMDMRAVVGGMYTHIVQNAETFKCGLF